MMGLSRVWITLIGIVLSSFTISVTAETDSPSFYGKRSVAPNETLPDQAAPTFQRRSIVMAPQIAEPLDERAVTDESTDLTPAFVQDAKDSHDLPLPLIELTRNEKLLAKKAQYYFDRNWNENTGLTDSVQGYHHVTMWDVASDISAQFSLEGLGLQSKEFTHRKLKRLLTTLLEAPLYQSKLPNREYSTKTGKPSGRYSNTKSNGNGWSALDIGRLLIWLHIIKQEKEELAPLVDNIVSKWSLASSVHNKTLYGTKLGKQSEHYRQEGRLGYLQYAASGFALFGFDVSESYQKTDIDKVIIDDIPFYIDSRNMPFSTPDPYVLTRLELGEPTAWWDQLDTIYTLHKTKEKQTKRLWVFGEDAMNQTPWFAYNNIFFYGKSWLSTSAGGKPIEVFQVFSNKVAFGLSVIYDDEYAERLVENVIANSLYSRSVPTGIYSDGLTNTAHNINTNSMILSSLLYKRKNNTAMLHTDAKLNNKAVTVLADIKESDE
ncbi:DUF3131 domain-containing protein [Aliivibrio sp. SR45-2]|nr:DUF3131 domain-containing protein [Aliivibrio sp. SR45-2]